MIDHKGTIEYKIWGLSMTYFNSCKHLVICTDAKNDNAHLSFFSLDFLACRPFSYIGGILHECLFMSS